MSLSNPLNILLVPPILYLVYRHFIPSNPDVFPQPSAPSSASSSSKSPTSPTWSSPILPNKYDPDTYNWMPADHPSVMCYKTYTPHQLAVYDGRNENEERGGRILLAIMDVGRGGKVRDGCVRTVFDVTAGVNFYGPDGVYGNFAGRDASRGMAKQSYDDDMLSPLDAPLDDLKDLTASEVDNMQGWHEHFSRKYIICGELVDG